jgi:pimeloyl-ACP methyl ester carboxylesterase
VSGPATERVPLAAWRAGGDTRLEFRGHAIFTRRGGDAGAPVLLLVHGFPTASWDWAALWPALVRTHRVLALDLLGFGFSAKPRAHAYSIAEQADLCEALLRAHGVRGYSVLAHDLGDTVAQELLARGMEGCDGPRLEGVVFLNGGLFPETHRPVLMQKLLRSPLGPLVARTITQARFDANMRRIFGATPPDRELLDGHWQLVEANDGRAVMHRLIRYIDERRERRARWVGALERATVPIALIAGLDDPVSGVHMVARWRELLPLAPVAALPGVGHYPQCEAPHAVLGALAALGAQR